MTRLRLDLNYDGTDFAGWAIQPGERTVQATLEAALSTVFGADQRLTVAGRTDAGVHAAGQVAHVDVTPELWHDRGATLLRRLAGLLPPDVRVDAVAEAPPGFDARFSALWRAYRYRITTADGGPSALDRHAVAYFKRRLDMELMAAATADLVGLHDFAAFCRHREGAGTVRELQELSVRAEGGLIVIDARADAFCHSMVRSLVGALAAVGEGRFDRQWLRGLLERKIRADEVTVAPAAGLTLLQVGYPEHAELGARAAATRAVRLLAPRSVPVPKLIDLSVLVTSGMPVYPGDPQVEISAALTIAEHGVNVMRVHAGSQSGTHVDAPNHTLASGLVLGALPLSRFTGPAVVAELRGLQPRARISVELLAPVLPRLRPGVVLLLCTGWSEYWATPQYLNHPWLEPDAAELIMQAGVRTVGVDALSIDPSPAVDASGFPAHLVIARAGGVIVENLRSLDQVDQACRAGREVSVSVFPIRLDAPDGAPVRAVARVQ